MGMHRDMMQHETLARVDDINHCSHVAVARESIYEKNYAVDSTAVEKLLKKDSLVPTTVCYVFLSLAGISDGELCLFQNAFSSKLAQFGFCLYPMFVVDLMHKFELSVWKAVFIHLLRILDCQDESLKHELDRWQAFLYISIDLEYSWILDLEKYLLSDLTAYEK
jgi:hypothetical protein